MAGSASAWPTALAAAGCAIHIWGRNAAKNAQAVERLRRQGGRAESAVAMSATASRWRRRWPGARHFGRVDGCFANAGVGGGGRRSFIERPVEEWRELLAINLDGAFLTLQAAARHMVERAGKGDPGGRLIVTSSLASIFGTARNEHYAASKAALNALTRALAVELARHRITTNAILPGWIKSDMTEGLMANEKFVANVMPRIPMRRFGEPKDFGGIAVYLMSEASAYHTRRLLRHRRRLFAVLRLRPWQRSSHF